nr:hypothetical protein [Arthrobacter sp. C9C5]
MAAMLLWLSAAAGKQPGKQPGIQPGQQSGKHPGWQGGRAPGSPDLRERGDVPGWVMITLMSAVLVAALLALAGPALEGLFNQAMQKVGQ